MNERAEVTAVEQLVMKPGTRLRSTVCQTQVIAVRSEGARYALTCGGAPMALLTQQDGAQAGQPGPASASGTQLGKRYVSADGSLELLCTRAGSGTLAVDGVAMQVKAAKPLPASD